jgi:hypothetical protein
MLTLILLISLHGTMALQDSHGAAQDKGLIIFDVSHGVWRDPDHGEFTISEGYSILAEALRDEGFTVGENRASLSSGLSAARVLVIVYLGRHLASDELSAIDNFVKNGGGLLILGDCNYNYGSDEYVYLNTLSKKFGIVFNSDTVVDPDDSVASHHKKIVIHDFAEQYITLGTGEIKYVWGSSLTVAPPAEALAFSDEDSWADRNKNSILDSTERRGPLPVVAASEFGQGRVVAIGEKRLLNNAQLGDRLVDIGGMGLDTLGFAVRAFHWLAKAQQDITIMRSGNVIGIVPNQIYQKYESRVSFTMDLLNKADRILENVYHKTFQNVIWEVTRSTTPSDPRAWGASFSRNKIFVRADVLDDEWYVEDITHELTHSLGHYRESYMIPPWLDEGLATTFSAIVPSYVGLNADASRIAQKLAGCGTEYMQHKYNYVLTWNYTQSNERCPTYGFAYHVTRYLVDNYGVGLVPSFFRLLELEGYPLLQIQDPRTGEFDLATYTSMVVQHLVVLAGSSDLVAKFKEWRFPVTSKTEADISKALSEHPSIRILKSADKSSAGTNENTKVLLEISNTGGTVLSSVEVLDSIPPDFEMINDSLSWRGTLAPGQTAQFSYIVRASIAQKYELPRAIGFYPDASGTFHVARSNIVPHETTITATVTETTVTAKPETTTSLTSLSTETMLSTMRSETTMQAGYGPLTSEALVLVGLAFMILAIAGIFYLRRRGK